MLEAEYNVLANQNREQIEQITLTNVTAKPRNTKIWVSFDYQILYKYQDWLSGDYVPGTYNDSDQWAFEYQQENGNWVLNTLGCTQLNYY